jgi:predicted enzyme related to lactoylglutathione lyase
MYLGDQPMANPVTWWEVNGSSGKLLQQYYASLPGWYIDANNPMEYGMADTHTKNGISSGIGHSDQGNSVVFYVEVDDPQTYLDKAVKMGGKVVMAVTVVPNMVTMAQFADPEGNVACVIKSEA